MFELRRFLPSGTCYLFEPMQKKGENTPHAAATFLFLFADIRACKLSVKV